MPVAAAVARSLDGRPPGAGRQNVWMSVAEEVLAVVADLDAHDTALGAAREDRIGGAPKVQGPATQQIAVIVPGRSASHSMRVSSSNARFMMTMKSSTSVAPRIAELEIRAILRSALLSTTAGAAQR